LLSSTFKISKMKFLVLGSCFLFTLMVTIQTSSALDNTTLFGDTKDLERKPCDPTLNCGSGECPDKSSCKDTGLTNCRKDDVGGGKCTNGVCCPPSCVENQLKVCDSDKKCQGSGNCKDKCCTRCANDLSCTAFCSNCQPKGRGDACKCIDGTCTCSCGEGSSCPNNQNCQSGHCVKEGECAPNEKCTKIVTVDINTCSGDKELLTTTTQTICEPIANLRGIDTDSKSNYLLLEGSSF